MRSQISPTTERLDKIILSKIASNSVNPCFFVEEDQLET